MIAALIALTLTDATPAPRCHGVGLRRASSRYAALIRTGDMRGQARLFGRDGVLVDDRGRPVRGERDIASYLIGRPRDHLALAGITLREVTSAGKQWRVSGIFSGAGMTAEGKPLEAQVVYHAVWACHASGWKIARWAVG